jgi:hypothetical protein
MQDVAAAANVAVGQNWPAPTAAVSWRRALVTRGPLPRTVQLCSHCRQHPAGFWVSREGDQMVRRPWCLSCCQWLDRGHFDLVPFDRQQDARRFR